MLSGLSDLLWNPTNRNPVHRLIPAEHQQDPVTAGPIVAVGKAVGKAVQCSAPPRSLSTMGRALGNGFTTLTE